MMKKHSCTLATPGQVGSHNGGMQKWWTEKESVESIGKSLIKSWDKEHLQYKASFFKLTHEAPLYTFWRQVLLVMPMTRTLLVSAEGSCSQTECPTPSWRFFSLCRYPLLNGTKFCRPRMKPAAKLSVVLSWASYIAIGPTTALYISRFRPVLTVTRRYCQMSVPDRPRWFHDVIGVSFVVHEAGSNPEEAFRYPWCRISGGWAIF